MANNTDAEMKLTGARTRVSSKAIALVSGYGVTEYDCGDWDSEYDTPYEDVCDASVRCETALLEYIAELEAKAGVKR